MDRAVTQALVPVAHGLGGVTASANSDTGTNVDMTVYGRIPGSQNVPANVYAGSITVTVTF